MIDLWGHLSARIPGGDRIAITPRFSRRVLPRTISAADVVVCDASGRITEGRGELPVFFSADLYRRSERQACIFAAPRFAMAAAIAGYALKPLTHMESSTGFGLGADVATATAVHERGVGVWAAGKDLYDALTSLYHLEYLAQVNSVVADGKSVRGISREDSDKLWG